MSKLTTEQLIENTGLPSDEINRLVQLEWEDFSNEVFKGKGVGDAIVTMSLMELRKRNNPIVRTRTPGNHPGYVYLLKVMGYDNLYKIGYTKNPDNRLKTFNVKLPFRVEYSHLVSTDDMYTLEANLHRNFANKRQLGSEFFVLDENDIAYIKAL